MFSSIDGFYIAAEIRLLRQVRKGTILIVEGPSDAKLFRCFIDKSACDIQVAAGKPNVCKALDLLEDEGFPGVLGIIDADFDRLTGKTYSVVNLCITDAHDLDLMLFLSPSLERCIEEHGNPSQIDRQFSSVSDIRARIISSCLPIAYCRLASERRNLNILFSGINIEDFVDQATLIIDQDALIKFLLSRTLVKCDAATLTGYMNFEKSKLHNFHQLVSGHDVAEVLGIAFRELLGNRRSVYTRRKEIEANLRLGFDQNAMENTDLYRSIRAWESVNSPFRIFQA